VPKDRELGNDNHGSKVIVVPFDGATFDRDNEEPLRSRRGEMAIELGQARKASGLADDETDRPAPLQ